MIVEAEDKRRDAQMDVYSHMCDRAVSVLLLTLLLWAAGFAMNMPVAAAQPSPKVEIIGGPIQLNVSSAPAGGDPPPATDASTTLEYSERRDETYKIIVSTSVLDQQSYNLGVEARNVNTGTSQGERALTDGMAPADLIRDVDPCDAPGGGPPGGGPPGGGTPCTSEATLRYSSSVKATDEPGTDSHTVQYTIVVQ